jgi:alkylhydroperoxidase/carboxymuconolactone decarboxylase family protein YurZ
MTHDQVLRILALGEIDPTGRSWAGLVSSVGRLDPRAEAFAVFGALIALDASEPSFAVAVDDAIGAGVTTDELLAVLLVLAPVVGSARVVAAAPAIGAGLGIDLEALLETDHP